MIDRTHKLPVTRQAELLNVSRGSVYYLPKPMSTADLRLMRRIDALHLEHPFAGSRMLRGLLRQEGFDVGRKHVATLMRKMGIEALYRRPNTSRKHPRPSGLPVPAAPPRRDPAEPGLGHGHHLHPDGPGLVSIWRPWSTGARGGCWLGACRSRWRPTSASRPWKRPSPATAPPTSSTPTRAASSRARHSRGLLKQHGIRISMDGKGAWRDNVFVERL